jgi:vancomycin resistance protein YoaR
MRLIKTIRLSKSCLLLLTIVCLFFLLAIFDHLYYRNRLYPGILLKEIDLGGKTSGHLEKALESIEITFTGPEGRYINLPLRKLGILPALQQVFADGYRQGRQSIWPLTYRDRLKILKEGYSLRLRYRLDESQLSDSIDSLGDLFNIQPSDAHFKVSNASHVKIIPEKTGYLLKKEELRQHLLQQLSEPDTPFTVILPVSETPAKVTAFSFREKKIEALTSTFTTFFDPARENRVHNIELAASYLNNYFLAPGEIFSFNSIIGNTTPEKGYKEAPIIIGGELVPGFGGGICQLSTTLYNAVLLANLEIIERHSHQLTVPYIPPGMDATVSYKINDLKFRNNKEHYILINSVVDKNTLTLHLFGQPPEESVEIETRILETYPSPIRYVYSSDLPSGEAEEIAGYPGCLVEAWKTVYRNGQVESREKISLDSYLPYPTVIRSGPVQDG